MTAEELSGHALARCVFESTVPVLAAGRAYELEHPGEERDLDEREFYVMRVGNRLAHVLSHCEQLEHAPWFLSVYRETRSAARAGATREKYLRFMIESYIVRTQTLYDLALKVTDAVFHLTNADSQCRNQTVTQNLKVKRTAVPGALKSLHKHLDKFVEDRNVVVHRGGYRCDDLDTVELYAEVERSYALRGQVLPQEIAFVPEGRTFLTRDMIRVKKDEYSNFSATAFELVSALFDLLHGQFVDQEKRLAGHQLGCK